MPNGVRGRYRVNTIPDSVDRSVDVIDRVSKLERTPQGIASPGINSIFFGEVADRPSSRELTDSATYDDLVLFDGSPGTVGPVVNATIGETGKCLVVFTALIESPGFPNGGYMGVDIAGPTPIIPSFEKCLFFPGQEAVASISAIFPFGELDAGEYIFTAKYASSGATIEFGYRALMVMPI